MTTYYLVGLKEKDGSMYPIGDMVGEDNAPSPLFTTKDAARKYRDFMQRLYPDKEYHVLKAMIMKKMIGEDSK